jgi:hypothetical protein
MRLLRAAAVPPQGHGVTGIRFAALTPRRNRSNLFMRAVDAARDQP